MNTAEYITNLVTARALELAGIGALWSLVYHRRILLAASPKADPQPQDKTKTKADTPKSDAEPVKTGPVPL